MSPLNSESDRVMSFCINKYSQKSSNVLFQLKNTNHVSLEEVVLTRVFAAMYPCADLSERERNIFLSQHIKTFHFSFLNIMSLC